MNARRGILIVLALTGAVLLLVPELWIARPGSSGAPLSLADSLQPPVWLQGGSWRAPLGTDEQGRNLAAAMIYGLRLFLVVGLASLALAMLVGVSAGLVAGYRGGLVDAAIMRLADIQLTFPSILVALLLTGLGRAIWGAGGSLEVAVLVLSISAAMWVQFARPVRALTLVEGNLDYVLAARVLGVPAVLILLRHILPNVWRPVAVIATVNLGNAILAEATLSFLGVGAPPDNPSLGTLINKGGEYLLAGEWWPAVFPGATLALLVFLFNTTGERLQQRGVAA